jgi:UDP-N-acetylmuramyl pentapeptide phosphotransferase/UDP-N-acetylglucosamine-1-phosphate transferase
MLTLFAAFILAAAIAAALVEAIRVWARKHHVLDHPSARSSHSQPMPRGGGMAIVLVVLGGLAVLRVPNLTAIALPALAVAAVSLYDDLHGAPASLRFAVHVAAAGVAIFAFGGWWRLLAPHVSATVIAIAIALTLFWIAGLTNAYNFMDGIDGIAGIQAIVAGLGWCALGLRCGLPIAAAAGVLIAGASAGFLLHNWSPARIFMGDVGSAFLGYAFAVITVAAAAATLRLAVAGILLVWPFVYDTTFTLIRRARRGERLSEAHRSHLYQRLTQTGVTHARVSILYGLLAVLGALAAWAQLSTRAIAMSAIGVVGIGAVLLTAGVLRHEARHQHQ